MTWLLAFLLVLAGDFSAPDGQALFPSSESTASALDGAGGFPPNVRDGAGGFPPNAPGK
jgi:hypothetical protein